MTTAVLPEVNPENQWRVESVRPSGWARSPRADARQKYFICSTDGHITPPMSILDRLDAKYKERLPRVEKHEKGEFLIADGLLPRRQVESGLSGEDLYRSKAGVVGEDPAEAMALRFADMDADGCDAEVVFPNGAFLMPFSSLDSEFAMAQIRLYNDWALGMERAYGARCRFVPAVVTGDVDLAIAEIERVAGQGAQFITLPTQPIPGIENAKYRYNDAKFEPMWDAIEAARMKLVFHVATAGDPRKSRGPGGAMANRWLSHMCMADPIMALCGSGILDRHPALHFSCSEGGAGWIPAMLDSLDETVRKHHMWSFPKLKHGMPSDYFREYGMVGFEEDRSAMLLCEPYGLENNFTWANDYPHQEGTWPHSAAAIERLFGNLREDTRAKILGLNAARFFKFDVPVHMR
jgi:predicted TIM-barrel fold metal-dependent hydrolase